MRACPSKLPVAAQDGHCTVHVHTNCRHGVPVCASDRQMQRCQPHKLAATAQCTLNTQHPQSCCHKQLCTISSAQGSLFWDSARSVVHRFCCSLFHRAGFFQKLLPANPQPVVNPPGHQPPPSTQPELRHAPAATALALLPLLPHSDTGQRAPSRQRALGRQPLSIRHGPRH